MIHRCVTTTGLIALALAGSTARADEIATRGQLDTLLGDKLVLEDFEGLSVHRGGYFGLPNPVDTDTTPPLWGLQHGVIYASPGPSLQLYGSAINGDDNVILKAFDELTIDYHQRQAAVGLQLVNPEGYPTRTVTAHFMRSGIELGQIERVVRFSSTEFIGWFDPLGIDRIEMTVIPSYPETNKLLTINDMGFGWEVANCPADLSGSSDPQSPAYGVPDGVVDASDFFYFLERFADGDQDVTDLTGSNNPTSPSYGVPDGTIDASDFFYYLDLFAHGCL